MKFQVIIIILFLLHSMNVLGQSQTIRDSIIGTYYCDVVFIAMGNTTFDTDTVKPVPDPLDTISFYIDDGKYCCWNVHMTLQNDSILNHRP